MNGSRPIKLPLWKRALEVMREQGIVMGKIWKTEFFEETLKEERTEPRFARAMISIKASIEMEEGLYLQQGQNGSVWFIPHEEGQFLACDRRTSKSIRAMANSTHLRYALLANPDVKLDSEERKRQEIKAETDATRLMLMRSPGTYRHLVTKKQLNKGVSQAS